MRAHRNPRLLFLFPGSFLLRFEARTFLALLFQLPPRRTRALAQGGVEATTVAFQAACSSTENRSPARLTASWRASRKNCSFA